MQLNMNMVQAKAKGKSLQQIDCLNLWSFNVSDVSLLAEMPHLRTFSAPSNSIETLETFAFCSELTELHLRANKICDINELNHLKNLAHLKKLTLTGNPIENLYGQDYRYAVLKKLPCIEILDNTDVSHTEVQRAQAMTPQCRGPAKANAEVVKQQKQQPPEFVYAEIPARPRSPVRMPRSGRECVPELQPRAGPAQRPRSPERMAQNLKLKLSQAPEAPVQSANPPVREPCSPQLATPIQRPSSPVGIARSPAASMPIKPAPVQKLPVSEAGVLKPGPAKITKKPAAERKCGGGGFPVIQFVENRGCYSLPADEPSSEVNGMGDDDISDGKKPSTALKPSQEPLQVMNAAPACDVISQSTENAPLQMSALNVEMQCFFSLMPHIVENTNMQLWKNMDAGEKEQMKALVCKVLGVFPEKDLLEMRDDIDDRLEGIARKKSRKRAKRSKYMAGENDGSRGGRSTTRSNKKNCKGKGRDKQDDTSQESSEQNTSESDNESNEDYGAAKYKNEKGQLKTKSNVDGRLKRMAGKNAGKPPKIYEYMAGGEDGSHRSTISNKKNKCNGKRRDKHYSYDSSQDSSEQNDSESDEESNKNYDASKYNKKEKDALLFTKKTVKMALEIFDEDDLKEIRAVIDSKLLAFKKGRRSELKRQMSVK